MSAALTISKRLRYSDAAKWPPRLAVSQAAAYLGSSENHVLKLIKTGALAAVNMARAGSRKATCYRITREALAEFENKRKAS